MSYILDALQKNASEAEPAEPIAKFPGAVGPPQYPAGGLSLPWKLAIGGVLLANIALVYLWRSDRTEHSIVAQTNANPSLTSNGQPTTYNGSPQGNIGKIPLPGILSPRDLPPPNPAAANNRATNSYSGSTTTASSGTLASGTGRTFRPTGRKITITGEPDADDLDNQAASTQESRTAQQTPPPSNTTSRVIPRPEPIAKPSSRARNASTLSALSDSARDALNALSFSFHIYGAESDLRSVGVNGQRTTEGQSIETESGKSFKISEITDSGAIIEFEHEGKNVSVAIPVMEDWKDS